jgi:uncharacterized lipoprotein YmbA
MRYIFALFLVWFVVGCGGSMQQYMLSTPTRISAVGHLRHVQIGVDKIGIPAYLSGNKIPVQSAAGELTYCDSAIWASAPEKGLTEHMIAYLQKRFVTPAVYRYPWDIERKQGVRLKVTLSRFVYVEAKNAVELEASLFVEPLQGTRRLARLFRTSVPVHKGETPLIVGAMNRAFDELAEAAARMIGRF